MDDRQALTAETRCDLPAVADALRRFGYDIEPAQPTDPPGASLVARRDRGDRAVLVAIDASGRFRVRLTWRVGEWASEGAIGGVAARVVDSVTRAIDAAGRATTTAQLLAVVAGVDDLAPWGQADESVANNAGGPS